MLHAKQNALSQRTLKTLVGDNSIPVCRKADPPPNQTSISTPKKKKKRLKKLRTNVQIGTPMSISDENIVLTPDNAWIVFNELRYHVQRLLNVSENWHRFKVLNTTFENKDVVLSQILDYIQPNWMIPVMLKSDGRDFYFMSRACVGVIEKLCRSSLTIVLSDKTIVMEITLAFSNLNQLQYDALDIVRKVVFDRFDNVTRHLDLSNFHKDPRLADIFFPLSYNRNFHTIVNSVLNAGNMNHVKSISFANNEITNLEHLNRWCKFKSLVVLDISNNLIEEINGLRYIKKLNLQELNLDKNPVCAHFHNELSYILNVLRFVPSLKKLDGVSLPEVGNPQFKRNYVSSPDDIPLADQFVRHYITLYDCDDRRKMEGLYHEKALFSLSTTPGIEPSTSTIERLTEYASRSRNLLKLSIYAMNMNALHQGSDAIMKEICRLPKTEHDPYSFKVDVVHCGSGVVVTVSGVFKESSRFIEHPILSFYRVFVLIQTGPKIFQIVNETLHITSPTSKEIMEAFKYRLPPKTIVEDTRGDYRKFQMIDTLCKLTTMNRKWSKQCLEESNWDIKEALYIFTQLYKIGKVPEAAFASEVPV